MVWSEISSSWRPRPETQSAPPTARLPKPTLVISMSVRPRRRVASCVTGYSFALGSSKLVSCPAGSGRNGLPAEYPDEPPDSGGHRLAPRPQVLAGVGHAGILGQHRACMLGEGLVQLRGHVDLHHAAVHRLADQLVGHPGGAV